MGTAEHHDWRIAEIEHRVSLSRRDIQHARYYRPDLLPSVVFTRVREENNNVFNPISVEESDAFRRPCSSRFSAEGFSNLSHAPHAGPLRPARPPQHPTG